MKKGTVFVLSIILLAALQLPYWANAEEEPPGLLMRKGLIKWGVSQAEARKATEDVSSLRFSCGAEDPTGVVSCTWACCVDLGEETTKYFATLWFHHRRFFKYEVTFSPKKFPSLVEAFEKRLGAPEKNAQSTIQNRMGTTFDQEERQWRTKNTEVQIAKRGGHGKFDIGYFVVIYAPIMSEIKSNNPAKAPF